MKRLDRYLFREMLPTFLVSFFIVVVMFQVNYYMAITKDQNIRNLSSIPFQAIFKIILYQTPSFVNLTLPIAVSLSTSLAVSRLARESELTALRAAGARVLRIVVPIALFGLLVGIANFFVVDRIAPVASRESSKLQIQIGMIGARDALTTNKPLQIKQFAVTIGRMEKAPDDSYNLSNVLLFDRTEERKVRVIVAPTGRYADGLWSFFNTTTWSFDMTSSAVDVVTAKKHVINEKVFLGDFQSSGMSSQELTMSQLSERIDTARKLKQDSRPYELDYHIRFSIPVMCLIFALVSPVFAIMFAKQGGFIGVLIGVVIVLAYYNAWVVCTQILIKQPSVSPIVAAWAPNLVFLVLGLFGLRRLE